MAATQTATRELTCPYCMKTIDSKKILFCIENKHAAYDSGYDPQFTELQQKYLTFTPVTKRFDIGNDVIKMADRPMYLYFPWTEEGCPEHLKAQFSTPKVISQDEGSQLPSMIRALLSSGFTPKQLQKPADDMPVQAQLPQEVNLEEENEEDEEQEEDLFSSKKRSVQQSKQVAADRPQNLNQEFNLTKIACPHCHGILPDEYGKLPMCRVVLLGASGSGKTTYMTYVSHLLTAGLGYPASLVSSAGLSEESDRYFKFLITCQKEARIPATVRVDDSYLEPTVFPIVMTVEGSEGKFILVMNDCPGEAVKSSSFITNYPALSDADGVIFIIDPLSCLSARGNNEIQEAVKIILRQEGIPANDEAIRSYHYATEPFAKTIDSFLRFVKNNWASSTKDRKIVMDLHKMDAIYQGLCDQNKIVSCLKGEDRTDLSKQHDGGMNGTDLSTTDMQLKDVITKYLQIPSYEKCVNDLEAICGKVYTLCTTTRNRDVQGQFVAPDISTENNRGRAIADADLMGFRMLEPLLCVLAQLRFIASKKGEISIQEERHLSWWEKLFGRRD